MSDGHRAVAIMGGVALVLGGMGLGYVSAQPAAAPDSPAPGQVHIAVIYDQNGEIADVDLTDSEGQYVPAGSIAESWPDDNTDEED